MAKARVYELAKELGVGNKEILEQLKKKNVEVKNHMSTVEDNVAEEIRRENAGRNEEPAKAEPAAEKAAEKDSGVPKKKNLAFVVRPQNSRNSSRLQGNKRPGANQGRSTAQGNARGGENRPVRAAGAEGKPVRTERAAQTGTRQERTDRTERPVRTERPAQTAGRTSGEGRPVRQERNDRPQRPGSDRENRPVRDSRDARGGRPNGDGRGQRQERGPRDNRDARGGREQGFGGRDNRDGRNGQGSRPDRKNDNRRNDRADRDAAPIVEQQKSQRNKAKDKERDNKKKEYRDEAFEGKGKKGKKQKNVVEVKKPQNKPEEKKEEQIKQIVIPEVLTIKELADKMKIVPSVIVKKLFLQGKVVTVNQEIDYDTAEEIAMEFDVLCEKEEVVDVIEELLKEDEEDESLMVKRPPVVCVMGHVDHGKTSLLDAIRDSNVTGREAGGITQHIGASVVEINGEKITFLDTPGHEAFTAMRMRGANSTDIAILVVAADDGVMPQTIEAINHAKAAGIEIIVAINKIDKPSANIERVKQELTEYELIPEDWGGSTIFVPVSAHTKEGIQELLEMILLTAEVMELKANPNRAARGLVIEAELDKGKGAVATAPFPLSSSASITRPRAARFGFAFSSITSAVRRIISRSSWIPSFVCADTGTKIVLPPQSSGISSYSVSSCFTRSILALGLSILLMATIISIPAAFAWLIASIVCGITPSSAATTRIAISVEFAPRIRIAVNASCPGVSRNVIFSPLISTTDAPMCCVIPPASRPVTLLSRIASRREVLPWSTCPITQTTGGRFTIRLSSSSSSFRSSSITSTTSSFSHRTSNSIAISSAVS